MRFFAVRRFFIVSACLALLFFLVPIHAQDASPQSRQPAGTARDWSGDIPAHLAFVDGSVTLERDGRLEPAEANLALLAGDRLRTRGGRVEVLFEDGSALYLDEDSELDLLSDALVRLLDGRMRLIISRATASLDYRIDAPAAWVWIRAAGEYRVEARLRRSSDPEVDLTVLRGSAELENEHGRTLVRAGNHAVASKGLAPSLPYAANSAAWDEFDQWADRQRAARVGSTSTRYLPAEVRYDSGAFDQYGSWDYQAPYGYVWYPRVGSGWRPYSQGRWSFTAHFGWLWVGIDRWSWPTHHYGRWGVSQAGWYWIPDHRWSPAWVSWGTAPGYVSWCPQGYDGRPVIGFRSAGGYYADPWTAWTVVPARVFAPNVWVTQHVVGSHTIAPAVRTQFVERPAAPSLPAVATARNIEPLRAPTMSRGGAVPRQARPAVSDAVGDRRPDSRATESAVARGSGNAAPVSRQTQGSEGRPTGQAGASAPDRAVPDRSSRVAPSPGRADVQRVEPSRAEITRPDTRDYGAPRALPRAPGQRPSDETPPSLGRSRDDQPAAPRAWEPPQDSSRGAHIRVPAPEPSQPSAPPRQGEPERARGRSPERTAPPPPSSAPPPAAAPPPSRGRGSEAGPPAGAPPPPSRGGGEPKAVPRARGGSGGD